MLNPALTHIYETLNAIKNEVQKDIIGQDELIKKLIITVFSWGHALIEWVPGLGKTKTIRTLASVLGLDTKRVSFTPDLLPSDLTGNEIYRPQKAEFITRKWPIFTNILLADEINRTPPKVQSALLEAMEEKRVTIWDATLDIPTPFIVFATQNPLEHEWTYPLPEAELDRFLMKIMLTYPSKTDEKRIFMQYTGSLIKNSEMGVRGEGTVWAEMKNSTSMSEASSERVWLPTETFGTFGHKSTEILSEDIIEMTSYIEQNIHVEEKIFDYVSDILTKMRELTESPKVPLRWKKDTWAYDFPLLSYWPSTRAGLAMIRAARVHALISGREFVTPDDIKSLAHDIIDHRIGLAYDALLEKITPYQITEMILGQIDIL